MTQMAEGPVIGGATPIITQYDGTIFRSRLEARWARFFDALCIPWLYETEGFDLPSGRYLPDFLLPRQETWIEIKPAKPSDIEVRLCHELCNATGQRVILAFGPFGVWLDRDRAPRYWQTSLGFIPQETPDGLYCVGPDERYWPCRCPVCGAFGFEFEGRGDRVCGSKCGAPEGSFTFDDPDIVKAVRMGEKESFWG